MIFAQSFVISRTTSASVIGKNFGIADEFFDLKTRNLKTEIIGGDVFDQMRFVKNHRAVIGQNFAVLIAAHV